MVAMTNNHNLFPLSYWAPALRRVPMPLQLLNEAYATGSPPAIARSFRVSVKWPAANTQPTFTPFPSDQENLP